MTSRLEFLRELIEREAAATRRATEDEARATRAEVADAVQAITGAVGDFSSSTTESVSYVGLQLRRAADALDGRPVDAPATEQLDGPMADLLNHATGNRGFAARASLWFNPPIVVQHRAGAVEATAVTERIVEVPFAHAELLRLPRGARILDVGCRESTLALSLASLGYRVTGIDLAPYPLAHPNLSTVSAPLEEWAAGAGAYDAICCLSSIEHFGLGAYGEPPGDPDGDVRAMGLLRGLLEPDGTLVLTVPCGRGRTAPTQRVYDAAGLERLLEGWRVDRVEYAARVDLVTWSPVSDLPEDGVALVVAGR